MAQEGITLTSVAIGSGANAALLQDLAVLGEGRAYQAGEFDSLPKIFAKETFMATGRYVQNRAFTPVVTENNSMTAFDGLPPLTGYLSTTARPLAQISLVSDTDERSWPTGATARAALPPGPATPRARGQTPFSPGTMPRPFLADWLPTCCPTPATRARLTPGLTTARCAFATNRRTPRPVRTCRRRYLCPGRSPIRRAS
jgi:hypothetical protein